MGCEVADAVGCEVADAVVGCEVAADAGVVRMAGEVSMRVRVRVRA